MEIKTKFNLGGKVWTLCGDKVKEIEIKSILVTERGIFYSGTEGYVITSHAEDRCFATKDELIRYITSE